MTFSVLMSVYKNDNPEFLEQALNSIYENQTLKPNEVVIVIDGPVGDDILHILEDFAYGKDSIVKILPQSINKGLGTALNIGVQECTCDYIFRMDSDDVSLPERFEKQAKFIEQHPEVDVLGAGISEFNNSLNEQMRMRICPSSHEEILEMGKRRNPVNHVTVCAKKQSILDAGNYQPLLYSEDYYLWIRMMNLGYKFHNLEEPLVYVRIGNGFENRRGKRENIKSWKTIQQYMVDNGMISKFQLNKTMLMMRTFTYMPGKIKNLLYKSFLRK